MRHGGSRVAEALHPSGPRGRRVTLAAGPRDMPGNGLIYLADGGSARGGSCTGWAGASWDGGAGSREWDAIK